jgi:hypothetical protein
VQAKCLAEISKLDVFNAQVYLLALIALAQLVIWRIPRKKA